MNLRKHRLFHPFAISLALTGCTIERIDLGGIDTIGGQISTDPTHHTPTTSATTTWSETEAPDTDCLAYKDDGESKLIPCSETTNAVAAGYCVLQNIHLPNQPSVCPDTPQPPLEPSSTTGYTATTVPGPATSYDTCTYIVENGSTVAVTCNTPTNSTSSSDTCVYVATDGSTTTVDCGTSVPQPSCAIVNDADEIIPVPCDEPSPTCAIIDTTGNVVPVPCEGTTTVPSCSGTIVTGETPPPCSSTGGTTTSPATTVLPSSDAPPLAPPPDDTVEQEPSATDEPDLVDAGVAPSTVDTTVL